jgi:hypothetical protein
MDLAGSDSFRMVLLRSLPRAFCLFDCIVDRQLSTAGMVSYLWQGRGISWQTDQFDERQHLHSTE